MYHSEVQTTPSHLEAGTPATLRFTVRDDAGRAVRDLELAHEKPMHLMVVSRDLEYFAHVHPEAAGDGYCLAHTFDEGGDYLLVADYQQPGRGQVVDKHRIHVEGPAHPAEPLEESARTQRADGIELTLHTDGELRAGQPAMLHFDAADPNTRSPLGDLELYLGARAHFMVLSEDGEDFVHVHALDGDDASRISAHAAFPRPGLYKLWAQLQRHGVVVTIPFVVRVGDAASVGKGGPATPPPAAGHPHTH